MPAQSRCITADSLESDHALSHRTQPYLGELDPPVTVGAIVLNSSHHMLPSEVTSGTTAYPSLVSFMMGLPDMQGLTSRLFAMGVEALGF